jgi:hypothetical protein
MVSPLDVIGGQPPLRIVIRVRDDRKSHRAYAQVPRESQRFLSRLISNWP